MHGKHRLPLAYEQLHMSLNILLLQTPLDFFSKWSSIKNIKFSRELNLLYMSKIFKVMFFRVISRFDPLLPYTMIRKHMYLIK